MSTLSETTLIMKRLSSDEFSQADIDTVYSGMDGYVPYKSGGVKDDTKGSYEYFKQLRKGAK